MKKFFILMHLLTMHSFYINSGWIGHNPSLNNDAGQTLRNLQENRNKHAKIAFDDYSETLSARYNAMNTSVNNQAKKANESASKFEIYRKEQETKNEEQKILQDIQNEKDYIAQYPGYARYREFSNYSKDVGNKAGFASLLLQVREFHPHSPIIKTNPYLTLGLGSKATEQDAKKAFRKIALTCHPDKVSQTASQTEKDTATAKFRDADQAIKLFRNYADLIELYKKVIAAIKERNLCLWYLGKETIPADITHSFSTNGQDLKTELSELSTAINKHKNTYRVAVAAQIALDRELIKTSCQLFKEQDYLGACLCLVQIPIVEKVAVNATKTILNNGVQYIQDRAKSMKTIIWSPDTSA